MKNRKYTLGVDYGTDSVRTMIIDTTNGKIMGQAVATYERWGQGSYCKPETNQFRQHPLDYIESLKKAVKGADCSPFPRNHKQHSRYFPSYHWFNTHSRQQERNAPGPAPWF